MKHLPDYVMRTPGICYALGAVIFIGYVSVGTYEIAQQNQYADSLNPIIFALRVRTVLDALNYSFYFVTTGIFLKVQIAIWQAVVSRRETGGASE